MGKIFYIMGKSSSGKDTIFKSLMDNTDLKLKNIILYTTRPIREGETDGGEYFFVDEEKLTKLDTEGKIIELRAYKTMHGVWKYFTVHDSQINLEESNYLVIGTLVSYKKLRDYFGEEALVPIYIEVEDGIRLQRALDRERQESEPKYAEMCRRFIADSEDFSEVNIIDLGIQKRFKNTDIDSCLNEITLYIKKEIGN